MDGIGQRKNSRFSVTSPQMLPMRPLQVRPDDEKRYADKVKDPNVAKFFTG